MRLARGFDSPFANGFNWPIGSGKVGLKSGPAVAAPALAQWLARLRGGGPPWQLRRRGGRAERDAGRDQPDGAAAGGAVRLSTVRAPAERPRPHAARQGVA